MRLTSINRLLCFLVLHASIRLFGSLRLQRCTSIPRTSRIEGFLQGVVLPAEEIIAVPAVASAIVSVSEARQAKLNGSSEATKLTDRPWNTQKDSSHQQATAVYH